MLINITVPGFTTCLPLYLDNSVALKMYSWTDIVSGNIVSDPDKDVTIEYMEYEGVRLDLTKSLRDQGIPENACIQVHIQTCCVHDKYNCCVKECQEMSCEETANSGNENEGAVPPYRRFMDEVIQESAPRMVIHETESQGEIPPYRAYMNTN